MKLYDCNTAPSPRRVRIFVAEKGIVLPTVQIDLRANEQFSASFRAINPDCTVPVLELESGDKIADAVAICRYIEAKHPKPALMGGDALEQGVTEAWLRRIELEGFYSVVDTLRNASPKLKGHALPGPVEHEQIPALAERGRSRVETLFRRLDKQLSDREFIAGARYSIADITALVTVDFARWVKISIAEDCPHLQRWHKAVSARPSASA